MRAIHLIDENATLAFGKKLALLCPAQCTIFLEGELGAGKTTFVRGFLQGLGYNGKVKSPTYTLVEPYTIGDQHIFHFDLYRIQDPEELQHIGLRDYVGAGGILLIEWPERGYQQLPAADFTLRFALAPTARDVEFIAHSEIGRKVEKLFK